MYHVISTGTAVFALYLICHFFYKSGFLTLTDHRKIWNLILAVTFIITAVAGLILALKVTYKWEDSFFISLLKWHVETGIAFSFTGIIHLLWHLKYFKDFFSHKNIQSAEASISSESLTAKQIAANLFFIGYLSSSVQLLLMREILNTSGGYELITGTFLASWLISSATGSFYAGKSTLTNLKKINTIFAVSPVVSLVLMILFNKMYLNPGETPSFLVSIIFTLIVLSPTCFISGFAFIKVLMAARENNIFNSGKSFSIETTGGIVAGLSVTLLTSGILNTYQILTISVVLFVLFLIMMYYRPDFRFRLFSIATGIIIILLTIWQGPDRFFRQILLQGTHIESSTDTPYGNITKGLYESEESTYYNHRIIRWKNDEIEREENIHYAMLQHDKPERVLLISGDPVSSINEILKYEVKEIFYVERDPELVKTFMTENFPGKEIMAVQNTDAYTFIRKTSENFDIVIMILPPPSTILLNRYYTKEFFDGVKKKMKDGGIFVCTPGVAENYYNYQSASLYSVIFNTLASVFEKVLPIAGYKLYFIASDNELSTEICSLLEKRGIKNIYVNSSYLDDELIKRKSDEILSIIDYKTDINTIKRPVACFHFQSYNLTRDAGKIIPALVIMFLLFFFPVFTIKPGNFPMYSAAASLAGFEILILMAIQSSAGNIYHLTGLVIAIIMAGLSAGAWVKPFFPVKNQVKYSLLLLLLFYLIAGFLIPGIILMNYPGLAVALLLLMSLIPSFLTGCIFKTMSEMKNTKQTPAGVYSSDLAGSALGFIAVSGVTIPLAGSVITMLIIAGLILAGFIFALIFR